MMLLMLFLTALPILSPAAADEEPLILQHVQQGERFLAQGLIQAAVREYEQALDAGAGSAMFLNRMGTLYMRIHEYDRATDILKKSLGEQPGQLPVYSMLGEAFVGAGKLDSALHYVREARLLAPRATGIPSSLAYLLLQRNDADQGDLPLARAYLDTALQLNPANPQAHRYLGHYYALTDSIDQAITAYQRVIELVPEDFEAYNNLGYLHLTLEAYGEALRYYEKARARTRVPYILNAIDERIEAARAILAGELRGRYIVVRSHSRADELLTRVRNGEDLATLARQYSLAPNAHTGGDTGFFGVGDLLPVVEQCVLELEVGQVSDVVELDIGYMIIKRLN